MVTVSLRQRREIIDAGCRRGIVPQRGLHVTAVTLERFKLHSPTSSTSSTSPQTGART